MSTWLPRKLFHRLAGLPDNVVIMESGQWVYSGIIDCFGVDESQRDSMMEKLFEEVWTAGGQLQVRRMPNKYDTDRYRIHCEIPGSTRPVEWFLRYLAALLPEDHQEQVLQGYDRAGMVREDLIMRGGKVWRRAWDWAPAGERPVR